MDLDGGPGVVRAFENHGGGTFADDSTDIAPGFAPTSIAVADVNGDGLSDVVGTSANPPSLGVVLSEGKSGFFAAPMDVQSGLPAASVVLGDVNGDGRPISSPAPESGTPAPW